jgi:phosphoenolpyruvate phosphomutase
MNPTHLRRILQESKTVIRVAGAHDATGARLAQKAGFEGIWASGFEISTAHGVPDAGILTMTEMLSAATTLVESVHLPVICDCETGFGGANNVRRMVLKYEAAGAAAVCIADAEFPKRNSLLDGEHRLESERGFARKIRAAKSAQRTPDLVVIARLEAFIAGRGLMEALSRASAYAAAGADMILVHSKSSTPDEVMQFLDAWNSPVPLVLIPTTYHSLRLEDLSVRGKVRMVIYANHGIRAAVVAMRRVYQQIINEGSSHGAEKWIAPLADVFSLQGIEILGRPDGVAGTPGGAIQSARKSTSTRVAWDSGL